MKNIIKGICVIMAFNTITMANAQKKESKNLSFKVNKEESKDYIPAYRLIKCRWYLCV